MEKVKISSIKDLKELLKNINEDGYYDIELDDNTSFYAISDEEFDLLSSIKEVLEEDIKQDNQRVKIISNDINGELSFEQFEILKKQINEALDKTLKPKAEKLN